jgi:iron complex transport system permease protein
MKYFFLPLSLVLLLLLSFLYLKTGSVLLAASDIWRVFAHKLGVLELEDVEQKVLIVWELRLPRLLGSILVGAGLGLCGAALQGLTRNPLAEPGLLGVSAGAAFAVVLATVLGFPSVGLGAFATPFFAFLGAVLAVSLCYRISKRHGQVSIGVLIMAGIALNSIFGAGITLMLYWADAAQLRSVTFWAMGSLAQINWLTIKAIFSFVFPTLLLLPFFGKSLNGLYLGENDSYYLGLPLKRAKTAVILLTALGVGACTAFCGPIGFVGLIVPHIAVQMVGGDYRRILPLSAMMGAIVLVLTDMVAKGLLPPAEIPTGVVTALVGTPFFLFLVLKNKIKENS